MSHVQCRSLGESEMSIILIIVCYLVGSIPVAWLMAKMLTGQDLRQMGSGNVGVMNTMVSVSRWAGVIVFLAEASKGALAVLLSRAAGAGEVVTGLAVLAAICGTRWSVWLRGAGGRGNTTAMTALLLISWPSLVCGLVLLFVARAVTRNSFVATRITLLLWPLAFGLITGSLRSLIMGSAFSLLFATTHRTETDDHLLVKERWGGFRAFVASPPRERD
jgi:glycerol-3-phosphate acyltransferase PlsY